jgi:hypothetical protein
MTKFQRTVKDNLLTSHRLPSIKILVNPTLSYVGGLTTILDKVTQVEQHHFVVADQSGQVQRLLWFQFEGFMENNERIYKWTIPHKLTLANFEFLHDTSVYDIDTDYRQRPNSDSALVVDFLKGKGFSLAGEAIFKRLVWLSVDKRNELMIIYSEDLQPTGYTAAALTAGDTSAATWLALSNSLHNRALASFEIIDNPV